MLTVVTLHILCWLLPALVVALLLIWSSDEPLSEWDRGDVVFWLVFSIIYPAGILALIMEYYQPFTKIIFSWLWKTLSTPINLTKKETP